MAVWVLKLVFLNWFEPGQFALALELIHSSRRLLQSELQGVECLRHADTKLKEMLGLTEKLMANEFVQVALYGSAVRALVAFTCRSSIIMAVGRAAH